MKNITNRINLLSSNQEVNGKAIPVIGLHGLLRIPHCLESQLTDGGKVVSLKIPFPFSPGKISSTHFC
jgi:hypothetical protein